jgi:hypothetical protein
LQILRSPEKCGSGILSSGTRYCVDKFQTPDVTKDLKFLRSGDRDGHSTVSKVPTLCPPKLCLVSTWDKAPSCVYLSVTAVYEASVRYPKAGYRLFKTEPNTGVRQLSTQNPSPVADMKCCQSSTHIQGFQFRYLIFIHLLFLTVKEISQHKKSEFVVGEATLMYRYN